MQNDTPTAYVFEGFRLDLARRRLTDPDGRALPLSARAYDVLVHLVEHRVRVVSKDELMRAVWSRVVVEENNLNQAIYNVRKALGDSRDVPRFIMTVAGRGYQFVADTRPDRGDAATAAPAAAELPAPAEPPIPTPAIADAEATTLDVAAAPVAAPTPVPAPSPVRLSRRWLLGAGGAAMAALAGAAYRLGRPARTGGLPSSVAVLQFKPLVESAANEAIELGITESMINRLSELPGIVVSPLSSARRFSGQSVDPREAGRMLRVAAVLDGHVQVDKDRLRLTARLIDVDDGRSLWAGSFNERLDDFFDVQQSLANQVVQTLSLELSDAQRKRLARRDTTDAEAWQLYLNGRYHWDRKTEDGILRSIEFYQAAAARDPQFALPHAGLADAYAVLGVFNVRPPTAVFPLSRAAAERAVELDGQLGEAHASLGHVATQYDRDWREGERLYRHALGLRPAYAKAVMWLANNHLMQGRIPEALAEARQAQFLEPMSLTFAANIGMVLSYAGRLDAALEQLTGLVEASPDSPVVRHHLARLHVFRGEPAEAIRRLEGFTARAPGSLANLGRAYALAGRTGDARTEIARLQDLGAQGFGVGFDMALIYAALDERGSALSALERALTDHSQMVGFINVDPGFDRLRDEPRFRAVVDQLGLA
jgi:DNA-binding winged helix-turn-helix (wHTH) protein/TolB-like protein/Flp pilus assembly protein TadD